MNREDLTYFFVNRKFNELLNIIEYKINDVKVELIINLQVQRNIIALF